MSEKIISPQDALNLDGTTDIDHGSGVPFPTDGQDPWFVWLVQCIHQLTRSGSIANNLRVFADADNAGEVGVRPGLAMLGSDMHELASAATVDLSGEPDGDVLVWAQAGAGSALEIGHAAEGDGWPESPHVRLAVVAIADSEVASITDMRGSHMLGDSAGLRHAKDLGSLDDDAAIDARAGSHVKITLEANITLTLDDWLVGRAGTLTLEITQDATGSRLVTWAGNVLFPGGTPPTLSTAANAVDLVVFRWTGTQWLFMGLHADYSAA